MNFTHTDDRRMLSDSLGRFIADRYDIDTRHKIAGSPQGYSPNRWQSFADLGAIAAIFHTRFISFTSKVLKACQKKAGT